MNSAPDTLLPRVTIITPSYNQGQYIEDTILSVLNQGYPNLEYIVIDGGSTDNSIDIIKKYSSRLTYWVSEKDTGQSNALNKGFRRATGQIINWLNSDDQLRPGALAAIVKYFQSNPDIIMMHGRIEYFGETATYYSRNIPKKDLTTRYVSHICMPQPACFYRKKLLDEQGLLDESLHFSMDTDLFIRAGLHYSILQVKDVFARFRLHAASKSVSSFNKNLLKENAIVFSRTLSAVGATKEIEKMKQLGLYIESEVLYNKPERKFDTGKMLFYFLLHRLYSLHNLGEKKEFKKLFSFLLKEYPGKTLTSFKLLAYRLLFFLPGRFTHTVAKRVMKK